jgi:hypothetical protein|tara:strand:- start:966 stop:1175 length:210 start_codon:yes stop_codon:yes gene_type:complete
MEELMDLLVKDESPSQVSDAIKDLLFAKTASKIEDIRPKVASSLFDNDVDLDEPQGEAELDTSVDLDAE